MLCSGLGDRNRLIALDLPGHGASADAINPEKTYTFQGYAEAVTEVLSVLGIDKAAIYGWSLGGYIGLEMVSCYHGLVGLIISGAPPVHPTIELILSAYQPSPIIDLVGKPEFSAEEAETFAAIIYGSAANDVFRLAVRRTDGRARALMVVAGMFAGQFADQVRIIETSRVPIAIADGSDDPLVNTDYVGSLPFANLWERHYFVIRGSAHTPFLQASEPFLRLLGRLESPIWKNGPQHSRTRLLKLSPPEGILWVSSALNDTGERPTVAQRHGTRPDEFPCWGIRHHGYDIMVRSISRNVMLARITGHDVAAASATPAPDRAGRQATRNQHKS